MSAAEKPVYTFGPFQADSAKRLLLRDGETIPVTSKVFDALLVLIEYRGQVVEKDVLLSRLWSDTTVEEKNLTVNISALRKALGESPQDHHYIVTSAGRGYSFVAEVAESGLGAELVVQDRVTTSVTIEQEEGIGPAPRGRRLWLMAATFLVLGGIVGAVLWMRPATKSTVLDSVAVLPFEDLTPGKDFDYFAGGLAEEVLNLLARIPSVRVAARTSSSRYKGSGLDVRRIASELGVAAVVEGSVRKEGNSVRISAQLIRGADGSHLWSGQFDQPLEGMVAVQEAIASKIAAALGAHFVESSNAGHAKNIEAFRLYLEGRRRWERFGSSESFRQGAAFFEQAIGVDPSFAPAYAGLADCQVQLYVSNNQTAARAREAVDRAMAVDPNSAEVLTALAEIKAFNDWDWAESERLFRRAIQLQPSYVHAHWQFACTVLAQKGRLDEALDEVRRAELIDPLNPLTHSMVAAVHWYRRELDKALEELAQARQFDPGYPQASIFELNTRLSAGQFEEASGLLSHPPLVGFFGYSVFVQAKLGHREEALRYLEMLKKGGFADRPDGARAYLALGDAERAVSILEGDAERRMPGMIWVDFDSTLNDLHRHPRYIGILKKMHLR